ncbi:MAG: hypothetical protein QFF03_19735 [Pseudomonadota bacterium]|nr:hypothetical protein [Pseudomonadota bacterium]
MQVEVSLPAGPAAPVAVISEDWAAPRPAPPPAPLPPKAAPVAPAAELTDPRVKAAVAATIAAAPAKESVPANQQEALRAPMLSAEEYKKFAEGFAYAKVPYCLGSNGLKFQPPRIGFIGFGGILGIPFVLLAAARGKCKVS